MGSFTALFDACVLYPAPLRGLLMYLALTDLFRAKWSADIHAEWMRNVERDRPDITRVQLERTRALMDAHVRDCLVTGYEDLITALELPDPDDRHVLAAAVQAGADVIVTSNLADFPAEVLARYGIEAWHPDEFVTRLIERDPAKVYEAARLQRAGFKNPPLSVEQYLASLERQGLPRTVAAFREHADRI